MTENLLVAETEAGVGDPVLMLPLLPPMLSLMPEDVFMVSADAAGLMVNGEKGTINKTTEKAEKQGCFHFVR